MPSRSDEARLRVLQATRLLDSPPEGAFDRLTRLAAGLLGAPVALVSLVDERRQFFKSALGLKEPWASRRETPLTHSFCQYATRERAPLVVDDARLHPILRENLAIRDLDVIAYAGYPLIVAGEAIGALCVVDDKPRVWTQRERDLLADLAGAAVSEIELRLALRTIEEQRQVYRAIVHHLPNAAVFLVDGELRYVMADGSAIDVILTTAKQKDVIGRRVEDVVSDANRAEILGVYRSALAGEPSHLEVHREDRFFELNAVPIRDGNVVTHALVVLFDVTERNARSAELERARAAIEKDARELYETSVTDELTGLLNRRGFMLAAAREMDVAARHERALVLMFLDLNGMKRINDELGHEAGDRALAAMAQVLRRVFRSSDVIARFGGDEFVVLATDAATTSGPTFASRLRDALTERNATATDHELSVSLGTAVLDPARPTTLEELLSEADARMYEEKRGAAPA